MQVLKPVLLCSLFLLLFVTPLHAQGSYQEFERGLNLTDSQRAQVEDLKRRYSGELRTLKQDSMRKRLELRELDRDQSSDPRVRRERTERVQRELEGIEVHRENLYRRYRGEVSGVFNEEQRGRYNRYVDREQRGPMQRPAPVQGLAPMQPPPRLSPMKPRMGPPVPSPRPMPMAPSRRWHGR